MYFRGDNDQVLKDVELGSGLAKLEKHQQSKEERVDEVDWVIPRASLPSLLLELGAIRDIYIDSADV